MTKGQALYNFILSLGITEEQLFDFMITADNGEDIFYELKNEGRQFVQHDRNDMPVHCAGFEGRIADDGKTCGDRVNCFDGCPYKNFWIEDYKEESNKDDIIKSLEKLGYKYSIKYYDDGKPMSYVFTQQDKNNPECSWFISIEDHHGELDVDDWVIYCYYHDPEQKDWDGHQIDIHGAVEFEAMRLIMEFVEKTIKEENKSV